MALKHRRALGKEAIHAQFGVVLCASSNVWIDGVELKDEVCCKRQRRLDGDADHLEGQACGDVELKKEGRGCVCVNAPIGAGYAEPALKQRVGEVNFDVLVPRVGEHNVPRRSMPR